VLEKEVRAVISYAPEITHLEVKEWGCMFIPSGYVKHCLIGSEIQRHMWMPSFWIMGAATPLIS
jgi:hypothetical protein